MGREFGNSNARVLELAARYRQGVTKLLNRAPSPAELLEFLKEHDRINHPELYQARPAVFREWSVITDEMLELPVDPTYHYQEFTIHTQVPELLSPTGQKRNLTPRESQILIPLVRFPNCVLTYGTIFDIWSWPETSDTNAIRVYTKSLREKLNDRHLLASSNQYSRLQLIPKIGLVLRSPPIPPST
ncbi:winged helix-turn-helix domain-containing protein [Candidatus Daviesbacteria bacterium]|nr:winged helix-turn-helix domain-containing protein [Candidatus Daviesbacteria bacterium]